MMLRIKPYPTSHTPPKRQTVNARLLEGGRDDPDLSLGPGDLSGDILEYAEARRVYAVVVGYENAHVRPRFSLCS